MSIVKVAVIDPSVANVYLIEEVALVSVGSPAKYLLAARFLLKESCSFAKTAKIYYSRKTFRHINN